MRALHIRSARTLLMGLAEVDCAPKLWVLLCRLPLAPKCAEVRILQLIRLLMVRRSESLPTLRKPAERTVLEECHGQTKTGRFHPCSPCFSVLATNSKKNAITTCRHRQLPRLSHPFCRAFMPTAPSCFGLALGYAPIPVLPPRLDRHSPQTNFAPKREKCSASFCVCV